MNLLHGKFGFAGDLSQCIGKTIADVEVVPQPFGSTWRDTWLVKFTDGTRAAFSASAGTGVWDMAPEVAQKCRILTPDEIGAIAAKEAAEAAQRRRDREDHERREYERLHAKFTAERST